MIEYMRNAKDINETNPRFLDVNIATIELERFERMTDDFTENPSNKLTNAIRISTEKDDDHAYMPLNATPLMYLIPELATPFELGKVKRP